MTLKPIIVRVIGAIDLLLFGLGGAAYILWASHSDPVFSEPIFYGVHYHGMVRVIYVVILFAAMIFGDPFYRLVSYRMSKKIEFESNRGDADVMLGKLLFAQIMGMGGILIGCLYVSWIDYGIGLIIGTGLLALSRPTDSSNSHG